MEHAEKIASFYISSNAGWWIDTDTEPMAVYIWPTTGDVLAKLAASGGALSTAIKGEDVGGIDLETDRGQCKLIVRTLNKENRLYIGFTEDVENAKKWADEVNKFFSKKREDSKVVSFYGPFWSSPVMKDIISTRTIYYLPGRYVRIGREEAPLWQKCYLKCCRELVSRELITNRVGTADKARSITLTKGSMTRPVSYRWMVDNIRYGAHANAKIMVPLELLFDIPARKDKIGLNVIGHVDRFQVAFAESLFKTLHDEMGISKGVPLTIDEFCKIINRKRDHDPLLRVMTMSDTAVDDLLKGLVFDGHLRAEDDQILAFPTHHFLADNLCDNGGSLIVAVDTGIMQDVIEVFFEKRQYKPIVVDVLYREKIWVGLAFRRDDDSWAKICRQAWNDAREQIKKSQELMDDFNQFREAAGKVSITIEELDHETVEQSKLQGQL